MKLEWNNKDANIGFYELELELEDGTKREIVVWDNTCEYQKRENEKDPAHARYNPSGFRVNYCHGYSMEEFFDDTHTLEEVKIWAENFLLRYQKNDLEIISEVARSTNLICLLPV